MITDPDIERYIERLQPPRDPVLAEMEDYARENGVLIVGPVVGRILAQLVMVSGARRIFELGSAIGYSTLWLARAAGEDAEVHYTDSDPANAERARRYFEAAGVSEHIRIHVGEALDALRRAEGPFDFIFNDIDKRQYLDALEAAAPKVKPGGLFVSDNALWHGRVLRAEGPDAKTVVEFTRKLFGSKDFFTTLLPVRDGILVSCKR